MVTPPWLVETPSHVIVWEWQAATGQAVRTIEHIIIAETKIPILAFILSLPHTGCRLLNQRR
jgi:hypothetical protein